MKRNRIKNLREMKFLTQEALAETLGTTQQRLSQIESGSIEPSVSEISKLIKLFSCSFEEIFDEDNVSDSSCGGILITYRQRDHHPVDPNYNYLIYGDTGQKETRIMNILAENIDNEKKTYLFFNTNIGGRRYITGYFLVDKVLHKGIDDEEIKRLPDCGAKEEDSLIVIGNREGSKILAFPLLLDRKLALSLYSLGFSEVDFLEEEKELVNISNKTRMHRLLSDADTKILISKCENRG